MARGKYLTDFELDVIRYGHSNGHSAAKIAEFLGRNRSNVWRTIQKMEKDGTLGEVQADFVAASALGPRNGR